MSNSSPSLSPVFSTEFSLQSFYDIIFKYQKNIHRLEGPVSVFGIRDREKELRTKVPTGFRQFLTTHNGAVLFYGDLHIRSLMELSVANASNPHVILFAQMEYENWAYTYVQVNGEEQVWFGLWENEQFIPLYTSFYDWLGTSVSLLDQGPFVSYWEHRLEQSNVPILFSEKEIRTMFEESNYAMVMPLLQEMVSVLPTPHNWYQYARSLEALGADGWREACIEVLRHIQFPIPYANFVPSTDVDNSRHWIASIYEQLQGDAHYTEICVHLLRTVWTEQVLPFVENLSNVCEYRTCAVIENIALILLKEQRNENILGFSEMVSQLQKVLELCNPNYLPVDIQLAWVDHLILQAKHNQAEQVLFTLRSHSKHVAELCDLRLIRIVVQREEPWGLHIIYDLLDTVQKNSMAMECWLLAAQYSLDSGALEHAEIYLDKAETVFSCIQESGDIENTSVSRLQSHYWLIKGELAQHQQKFRLAGEYYQYAKEANTAQNSWMQGKILLAEGNLYVAMKEINTAVKRYEQAYTLFSNWGAVLESAQVLMQWGFATDTKELIVQARTMYQQLQFASKISVADGYLQEKYVQNSQQWYLDLAMEMTQLRSRAQKSTSFGMRQEADCPERRLYGLRMAVANSDVSIVAFLSQYLLDAVDIVVAENVSSSHEKYIQMVATFELICAHLSYRAVETVLKVLEKRLNDTAGTAIGGVLIRCQNVGVINELIHVLQSRVYEANHALIAEVLGFRREKTAIPTIVELLHNTHHIEVKRACVLALGRMGEESVADTLYAYNEYPDFIEEVSLSLLLLGQHNALAEHAQELAKGFNGNCVNLGHLVGRYGGPRYMLLLFSLAKSELPVNISAIHGLGYLGEPRSIPLLIELSGFRDVTIATAASHALELITGHYENPEEYLLRARWQSWYDKNEQHFENGYRYRGGTLMSAGILIENLWNDDRLARLANYDELVITTGVHLPFDIDGNWRIQKAQIRAWEDWWQENAQRYPVGRWMYQGEVLS